MSIENRLTALQNKLEELVALTENGKVCSEEDLQRKPFPSAIVEIRTLELWKSVIAECLGSLCYVFIVCGVSIPWTGHFPPFLSIAFATALVYGALTFKVFRGAHLNPAFSIALMAIQKISAARCLLYITAQCGGAIAGAAILFGLTVPGYQGTLGATTIASHVEPFQAFGLELILTFILTLTYVSDPKNCVPTSCVLLAVSLVGLPCTGAGLNPIRSLGPAFVMNKWPRHWVFWLGPILGALLASYFHKYVLKRRSSKKGKEMRNQPSDGDSLDISPTELPVTTPDRLLCERLEPIYGGTRSLYLKPSPVLPRTNLNRSQSVYASKRFEYPPKFLDSASTSKKLTSPNPDTNYESLYDRKPGLLVSGPPSYDSSYYKTFEKGHSGHSHGHNNHHHCHHREKSDSSHQCSRDRERESHTSRILAQYETAKGFVDVDPKAALRESNSNATGKTNYYETSDILRKHGLLDPAEKKLIDTSSGSESGANVTTGSVNGKRTDPPPPPRFRIPIQAPSTNQESPYQHHRFHSGGQNTSNEVQGHDLSRANSINKHHGGHVQQHQARKPYEMLEGKKLMEFSPNSMTSPRHDHQNSVLQQEINPYSPRLLMEKDSTYSRIVSPILSPNSISGNGSSHQTSNKHHHHHQHPQISSQGQGQCNRLPEDHLTYSYH